MSLLNSSFDGLSQEDFDIYRPECWSSNQYNLARMRTKERVVSLVKSVSDVFAPIGLKWEASSEIPSVWNGRSVQDQWGYWVRDDAAQRALQPILAKRLDLATRIKAPADHFKHALFCVRLSEDAVGIGLRLSRYATVDVANLVGRAQADSDGFLGCLDAMDEQILLNGVKPTVNEILHGAAELQSGEREWMDIVRRIERDDAVALGDTLSDVIGSVAQAVAPLLEFLLWSTENDHINVSSAITQFAEQTEARTEATRAERESKIQANAERALKARDRTTSKMDAEEAWRRMQASRRTSTDTQVKTEKPSEQSRTSPPPKVGVEPSKTPHVPQRKTTSRKRDDGQKTSRPPRGKAEAKTAPRRPKKAAKPSRPKKPAPVFEVGQTCVLTRGLFAGKKGQIVSVDKPGYYAVKVGILEVNVSGYDLQQDA